MPAHADDSLARNIGHATLLDLSLQLRRMYSHPRRLELKIRKPLHRGGNSISNASNRVVSRLRSNANDSKGCGKVHGCLEWRAARDANRQVSKLPCDVAGVAKNLLEIFPASASFKALDPLFQSLKLFLREVIALDYSSNYKIAVSHLLVRQLGVALF